MVRIEASVFEALPSHNVLACAASNRLVNKAKTHMIVEGRTDLRCSSRDRIPRQIAATNVNAAAGTEAPVLKELDKQ